MWTKFFKSQNYGQQVYKHIDLPLYKTKEFDFFRCVEFKKEFYCITVSKLNQGNLRTCTGRYSKLFPNQKLSYWADSAETARAEVKKHGASNNLLTFWAYDDVSSFEPTIKDLEYLKIVDGRQCGIQQLIDKVDNNEELTNNERILLKKIMQNHPDALAFDSRAKKGGENFIFFERGFKKLSLREVRLRFGNLKAKNNATISCAYSSDYTPSLDSYGKYFMPICKIKMNSEYLESEEYKSRDYFSRENMRRKFEK